MAGAGSSLSGGIRHDSLSTGARDPGSPAEAVAAGRPRATATPPIATATTAHPPMMVKIWPPVIAGNMTEAVSTPDSVISTAITPPVNRLVFGGVTHGPSTGLSLQSL